MKRVLAVGGAALVAVSCLAPDVEIVSSLGSGGFAGIGNVGGAVGSGGTSNPVTCPPELPPIGPLPCAQEGLACDYSNMHCVCRQFLLDCSTSGSGGSAGVSSGGAAGSAGTSAGSGGSSGNAGSGGSGGSAGQGQACIEATGDVWGSNGYFQYQTWNGYAFAAAEGPGTTIEPANFDGLPEGAAPCVCGTVPVESEAAAGIGVFIGQQQQAGSTPDPVAVFGSGLGYDVQHSAPYMRVELQGLHVFPEQHWCVDVFEQAGTIPWGDFQTDCATGNGVPFDRDIDLITNVAFYFSSEMSTSPLEFELCVIGIESIP